jgi:hypothetical protein
MVPPEPLVPRKPRCDLPGTTHHVTVRGVDGLRLFPTDGYAFDFLRRFARWLRETKGECLAWSLNGNHAHLVIRRGERPMAELMARSTSAFAQHFNAHHGRVGHLLQSRYKSRMLLDEHDLRWTALYALGNPARHQIVDASGLDAYLWSGWSGAMGKRPLFEFESFAAVFALFGGDIAEARCNLRDALESAIATRWAPPADGGVTQVVTEVCAKHRVPRAAVTGSRCAARDAQTEIIGRCVEERKVRWRVLEAELAISRGRIARALRGADARRRVVAP